MPNKRHDKNKPQEVRVIIAAKSIKVISGPQATLDHMLSGKKNEYARCIQGTPQDLADMFADAAAGGHPNGPMMFMVGPGTNKKGDMTEETFLNVVLPKIALAYDLPVAEAVVFVHGLKRKNKARGSGVHFHVAWNSRDPLKDRARDWSWTYAKNELLSRSMEVLLNEDKVLVGRFQPLTIRTLRERGENELADKIEQANPADAKPAARTAKRQIEQPAKAAGIDHREVIKIVRPIWQGSDGLDSFSAGLASVGLKLTVSYRIPDCPAWVLHTEHGFLRSLPGALPGVSLKAIIAKLGEPPHEHELDNAEQLEPVPGVGSGGDSEIFGIGGGLARPVHGAGQRSAERHDPLSDGQVRTDGEEAAAILVAAVSHLDGNAILHLERRAEHMSRGPLLRALEFFDDVISKADGYLERAAHDVPQVGIYLANLRKTLAALLEKLGRAKARFNRWNVDVTTMRHMPKPSELSDKEHKQQVREAEINLKHAELNVKRGEKVIAAQREFNKPFETAYDKEVAIHKKETVEPLISTNQRRKRVAKRCLAMLEDSPEMAQLGAPALYLFGLREDVEAKPGATWTVDPPDDGSTGPTFQP